MDLSEEITTKNMFLQYIRFSASGGNAPREYLIPCYVASCCNQVNIDGIKYYGSKEYKNYVSWSDGYFDVETTWELSETELQELEKMVQNSEDGKLICAANILLGNRRIAQKQLERMTAEDRELFISFPIYNLL